MVTLSSTSANATFYTEAVSNGATETITLGSNAGVAATVAPSTFSTSLSFTASPVLSAGANAANITALSGGGTASTNSFPVNVASAPSQSFTYDAEGEMTSDGTNTYVWDGEHRLLQINYSGSGNNTQFSYDPMGRCSKIVETVSSSVTRPNSSSGVAMRAAKYATQAAQPYWPNSFLEGKR